MTWILIVAILVVLVLAPQAWVRYVLWQHHRKGPTLRGSGAQLAEHLIERFEITGCRVETCAPGQDHYSPAENVVRLSPDYHQGRSLTAIAVAAHEVGHALQFQRQEPISRLRQRYLPWAYRAQQFGAGLLLFTPLLAMRLPHAGLITAIAGAVTLLASVAAYVAILPEEFDASFNKALPILTRGDYISAEQVPVVRRILRACAMTYVAAALADVLRLWRWIFLLRR